MGVIKRKFEPNFAGMMYWRASSIIHHFILVALKTDHREYLSFWLANVQTNRLLWKNLAFQNKLFSDIEQTCVSGFSHKTFEYFLHTRTLTLFNQDRVFIWCSVLIGWYYFFFKCEYKHPQAFYNRQSWCTKLNKKDTFDGYYWNGFIFQIYTKW